MFIAQHAATIQSLTFIIQRQYEIYYIPNEKNHSILLHFEAAKGHPALRAEKILESEAEMAHVILPVHSCPLSLINNNNK